MSNLPQEIIDRISGFLDRSDLWNTLTVSHAFQAAAEHHSGAFISYTLTPDEYSARQLIEIYASRRFHYLRNIKFETSLPGVQEGQDELRCTEFSADIKERDEIFTRQIVFLFETLRLLGEKTRQLGRARLQLTVYSPTRQIHRQVCHHDLFSSWRIHLLSPENLPCLNSIRSLNLEADSGFSYSRIDPGEAISRLDFRILLDLASKMPNLEYMSCQHGCDEYVTVDERISSKYFVRGMEGPRRDTRQDFAKVITSVPTSLRYARLDFIGSVTDAQYMYQRAKLPNFVSSEASLSPSKDIFSSSLRFLSYQLRRLQVRVMADETIFWPSDNSTPCWPNLEHLSICFNLYSPSGEWYFQGPPCVENQITESYEITNDMYPPLDRPKEHPFPNRANLVDYSQNRYWRDLYDNPVSFRTRPIDQELVPFLSAFAKAAATMHQLKEALLWTPIKWNPIDSYDEDWTEQEIGLDPFGALAWGIVYMRPGQAAFDTAPGVDYSDARQIWWKVGGWRPDRELHRLFQQIGKHKEVKLLEHWHDETYGKGLVGSYLFEDFSIFDDVNFGTDMLEPLPISWTSNDLRAMSYSLE